MVTPFQANGKVDFVSLEKLVKHLHTGADYMVVMGTTGEAVTLSENEQFEVLDFILKVNAGKLPVVYGMGGNNTADIVDQMRRFNRAGVTAYLSASPAYNKPSQEGIYHHYKALSSASSLPIILYNVPGRTACNVLPDTVLRIAKNCNNVVAIKEAAGSIPQVMELSRILPDSFLLLSGDDDLALAHLACGGHGIISVVGNAYPRLFSSIISDCINGEFTKARKNHFKLLPLISNLFAEGNPAGIKEALKHLGICENQMRLPLYPVSKSLSDVIKQQVEELKAI